MGVSKVVFGNDTLIDLTNDTVTPDTLAKGATAHASNGDLIVGTGFSGGSSSSNVGEAALLTAMMLDRQVNDQIRISVGKFKNAGAGWNTYSFPEELDFVPYLYAYSPGGNLVVEIGNVTTSSFQYRLLGRGEGSGYKHTASSHSSTSTVTAFDYAWFYPIETTTDDIFYVAFEKGGENAE